MLKVKSHNSINKINGKKRKICTKKALNNLLAPLSSVTIFFTMYSSNEYRIYNKNYSNIQKNLFYYGYYIIISYHAHWNIQSIMIIFFDLVKYNSWS